MEDYPRTLMEFEKRFSTDKACRDYLSQLRWPEGYRCPQCGHGKSWPVRETLLQCSGCGYQTSMTAGTIFQGTRKPLTMWFRAMWWVTNQKNGGSALGLQRTLGLGSYETAWEWLHKLRRAMVRPGRDQLSGKIEVDETYVGGEKPGKRGRGAFGKTLVLIAAQFDGSHMGRIRLKRVADASVGSLESAIKDSIQAGSVIRTDGWRGYSQLKAAGYVHEIARLEAEIGENLLPACNRVAALLKRWLLGTHQGAVNHSHLDYYLDEFTFRFNRRSSAYRGKLFYRLLQQAAAVGPSAYRDLIEREQEG